MTDAPSQDRLQSLERRFHAAVRNGDFEALEQELLHVDFDAIEFMGEGRLSRQEFLRRAIYGDVVMPTAEPRWIASYDDTTPGRLVYRWTDAEGVEHTRGSWWIETDAGLRLRQYFTQVHAFNGAELRR